MLREYYFCPGVRSDAETISVLLGYRRKLSFHLEEETGTRVLINLIRLGLLMPQLQPSVIRVQVRLSRLTCRQSTRE